MSRRDALPPAFAILVAAAVVGWAVFQDRGAETEPAAVRIDASRPGFLVLGDGGFRVELAIDPVAAVPEWWGWDNNGGVHRVSRDGVEFLTSQGMPERWDLDGVGKFDDGSRLVLGQGWKGLRGEDGEELPPQTSPPRVAIAGGAVTCEQEVAVRHGYGYRYRKTFRVDPVRGELRIDYALTNTGAETLELRNFVHGYFNLGGGPVDEAYSLETPMRPREVDWLAAGDDGLRLTGQPAQPSFAREAEQAAGTANRLALIDAADGCAVTMTGDFPPHLFALYVEPEAIVPEVTVQLTIPAGETRTWSRTWRFAIRGP